MANWTAIPTPSQVACMRDAGIERAIVGASYGGVAPAQLTVLSETRPEVYGWLSFGRGDYWKTLLDRAIARHRWGRFFWLDVEADPEGMTSDEVLDRIQEALNYVSLRLPDVWVGIYTAAWWWRPYTRDSGRFGDVPVWLASYSDPGDTDVHDILCGGWSLDDLVYWQYAGSVTFCGLNVDLNLVFEEGERMTPKELERLNNLERQALQARIDLNELANGADAIHQGQFRYLWALAKKAWPF